MSETVYVGLGCNLGDREHQLMRAVAGLRTIDAVAVLRLSSLYDSAPVGPAQPRYLNAVVELECGLAPQRLLTILKHLEVDLGRTPGPRWGPRALDMDVLLWEGRVVADANLQVPHLGLHQRRFALEPLVELTPEAQHPVLGQPLRELFRKVMTQDVVRLDSLHWSLVPQPAQE